jgi:hypothetical protein
MADGDNQCIAYYDDAKTLTAVAEAAVTGCRFVNVSDPQDGPAGMGLSSTSEGSNIKVSHAAADGPALGVSSYDAGVGKRLSVERGGQVVPVMAGAAITAGQRVEVGANGTAVPFNDGIAVGIAIDDIANGAKGPIALLV